MESNIDPSEKWNIQNFSGSLPEDDFQIQKMLSKLEKIKTKKTKKPKMENYKNIEPLINVHDDIDENDEKMDENVPDIDKKKTLEGFVDPLYSITKSSPVYNDNNNLYNDDNWYGWDPVQDNGSTSESIVDKLIRYINNAYKLMDYFIFYIARLIAVAITFDKIDDENDIIILKKNVGWFFSIMFAWIFVFNWFYLSFYKPMYGGPALNKGFYRENMKNKESTDANGAMYTYLIFWFEFAIFFPEKFQEYFVIQIPAYVDKVLNKTSIFIIIFFIMISLIYNCPNFCRKFLVDALKFDQSNFLIVIMLLIVVYLFFTGLVTLDLYGIIKTYKNILSIIASPVMIIVILLCHIVRFLFALLCTIPIAGLLVITYFIAFSLFGINIYGNTPDQRDIRKKIWEYIKPSRDFLKEKSGCEKTTFWEPFINAMNMISDFIYKYSLWIAFIYMLFISIFDYSNMKTNLLRMALVIINLILIFILCIMSYTQYRGEMAAEMELLKKKGLQKENNVFINDSVDKLFEKAVTGSPLSESIGTTGLPFLSKAMDNNIIGNAGLPFLSKSLDSNIPTSMGDLKNGLKSFIP